MITERYNHWVALMAKSDANLVQLAAIGLGVMVIWQAVAHVPEPWAARVRLVFLLSSAALVVEMVTQIRLQPAMVIVVGLVGSLALAVARWVRLGRAPATVEGA